MVIVGGTFELDPNLREEFLAGRLDTMRRSRAEKGCLEYTFAADPIDPARVVLFERWATQEDLDAHLSASHPPDPPRVEPRFVSILVYDVTGERSLRS